MNIAIKQINLEYMFLSWYCIQEFALSMRISMICGNL